MTTNVFEKDLGGLENFANNLIKIIETEACINKIINESGAVISLDAKFGMGKTHFLQMFENHLKTNGFDCFFIDAWKSDFYNSPLLVIICELINYLEKKDPKIIEDVTKKLKKVLKIAFSFFTSITNQVVQKTTGINVEEAITSANQVKNSESEFDENGILNNYLENKKSLDTIKTALEEYTNNLKEKPLIILVDELDRAKPSYAVEFLEAIKHFFDVKKIVFVLAVNKEQIEQSVKCLYGNIDFNEYYRKFATRNIALPNFIAYNPPDRNQQQDYFTNKTKQIFEACFGTKDTSYIQITNECSQSTYAIILFLKLSPRQINEFLRILAYSFRYSLDSYLNNTYRHQNIISYLRSMMTQIAINVSDKSGIIKQIADQNYDWSEFLAEINESINEYKERRHNSCLILHIIKDNLISFMSKKDFDNHKDKIDNKNYEWQNPIKYHINLSSINQEIAKIILNDKCINKNIWN